jgi:Cytochrome c
MEIKSTHGLLIMLCAAIFSSCDRGTGPTKVAVHDSAATGYRGFPSQIAYGRHLVEVTGCGDCHTPKKMTNMGPVPDTTQMLSGHPASMPAPDVDRKEAEKKGLALTNDMTAWVGPWGISYAANLTPDSTGIGNWSEAQFFRAMRQGKFKGLEGSRPLLPPMPWQDFALMNDEELKAIFAYLKSVKPVNNVVPPAVAPMVQHQ